jgi:hypothetical protein
MARWRYRFLQRVRWRSRAMFECDGERHPRPRPLQGAYWGEKQRETR